MTWAIITNVSKSALKFFSYQTQVVDDDLSALGTILS